MSSSINFQNNTYTKRETTYIMSQVKTRTETFAEQLAKGATVYKEYLEVFMHKLLTKEEAITRSMLLLERDHSKH